MATRKLRPQQYRIEGSRPWADSAEDIDTMFETLFKQIKQLQNAVAPTPVMSGAVDVSHIVGSIPRSLIVEPEQGRIGPPGVPGATGPQGPAGSGAAAIGPPGRPGQDAEAPFNPMGALNTPSVTGTGVLVRANSPALTGSPTAPTQSTSDNSTDIATTAFVTTAIANAIAGVNPAVAVQAASAAILPNSPTYNNGASGIGAFITTLTLNTALVVDGYTPSLNDRILVKNEGDASGLGAAKNGVYTVTQIAAVGLAWILTRALDYNMPSDINNTGAIPVVNGTNNAKTSWLLTSQVTVVGTDPLTYIQFSIRPPSEFTTTATGNIDDLDFANASVIRMNNASLSTLRGLKAGIAGQQVTIVSVGAGEVDLAHQNTGSAAANRLINMVTSGITPLAPGVGTSTYEYDATTARWRLVSHVQGDYITIAYASGNFTGSGTITWTVQVGDQTTFAYYLNGRQCHLLVQLDNTSVSGVGVSLRVTIPFTVSLQVQSEMENLDNGSRNIGRLVSVAGGSTVQANNNTISNWSAATDATTISGSLQFPVT